MPAQHSDLVHVGWPAHHSLEEEKAGDWSVFILNDQLNDILRNVVRFVMSNDLEVQVLLREGTYGQEKLMPGRWLKHLLCGRC